MIDLGIEHLSEIELIGRGGFSTVYAATDTRFDRRVAVKVLGKLHTEKDRQRFERECKIMGRLSSHPHVVTVYDAGYTTDNSPYLVMELVTGGSMADRLQKQGPLPWRRAVEYMIPIADALGHGHTQGILHRDVKPENILMAGDQPRLTDFGIASARDSTGATSTNITASWLHTAPETFANSRDERSDLYSLMSTLHTLIQGNAPFWAPTDESLSPLMYRLLHQPPPPLPANLAPPAVVALLQRGLAKDPAHRPQNANELIAEMRRVLENPGPTTSSNPTQVVTPVNRPPGGPTGSPPLNTGWPATGSPVAPAASAGSAPYQAVLTPPGGYTGAPGGLPQPPQGFSGPRPDTGPDPRPAPPAGFSGPRPTTGPDPRPAPPAGFSGPRPTTGPGPAQPGPPPPQGFTAPQGFTSAPPPGPAPGRQGFTTPDGRFATGAAVGQPVGYAGSVSYEAPRPRQSGARLALLVGLAVFVVGAVLIAVVIAANNANQKGGGGGGNGGGTAGSDQPVVYSSSDWMRSVAVLDDGRVVGGNDSGEVTIWDLTRPGTTGTVLTGHSDYVRALVPLSDGRLASGSDDYTVRVWDPDNTSAAPVVIPNLPDWAYDMAQLPDGRLAVAAGGQVVFVDPAQPAAAAEIYDKLTDYVSTVVVLEDGRLAAAGSGGTVSIIDPTNLSAAAITVQYDSTDATSLAVLPDGRVAVTNGNTVNVFDPVSSALTPLTFTGHTGIVNALTALPDGRVVSASEDGTVQVWDPDTSINNPVVYRGHEGAVLALASFPDGRVVSGGDDKTVQVWDPDSL